MREGTVYSAAAGVAKLAGALGIVALLIFGMQMSSASAEPGRTRLVVEHEVVGWHVVTQVGPRTFALRVNSEVCGELDPGIEAVGVDSVAQPNGIHRAVVTVTERWTREVVEGGPVGFGPRYVCATSAQPEFTVTLKTRLRHTRLYDGSFYPHPGRGVCPEGVKRWTAAGMAVCG